MNIVIFPKKELLIKWSEDKKWYETTVGEPPKCLRCGKVLPPKISHCALSRHIDVQICSECGTEEAMLDWDGKVACTIYLAECDFRCPYCHNKSIVPKSKHRFIKTPPPLKDTTVLTEGIW